MNAPSRSVLRGFGLRGSPTPVPGGEGRSFRAGDAVLKRAHDVREAGWTQEVVAKIQPRGFRLARPVPATAGGWVCEGWSACEWIEGLRPAAPDWPTVIAAGLDFGDAAEAVRDDGDVLRSRTHRWAVADRVAWGEERVELSTEAGEVLQSLATLLDEVESQAFFVHGDLSGNVFLDPDGVPVILDVSPYLRPRRWAAAIVIVDAALWSGMPLRAAARFAFDARHRDLVARALIFRLVAEQLADDPHRGPLAPYRRVLAALDATGGSDV